MVMDLQNYYTAFQNLRGVRPLEFQPKMLIGPLQFRKDQMIRLARGGLLARKSDNGDDAVVVDGVFEGEDALKVVADEGFEGSSARHENPFAVLGRLKAPGKSQD